ncbi:sigma-70 family RNA polymerase sigma factor [Parafrigoribacterium humi]|uniref:sigma-70 family RNA polymerase sigma factor n=2 Tax=Bacteria TaxID=2 RepID=UPI0032EC0B20
MADQRNLVRRFEKARPRLLAIATRLLSSGSDAEDAVQETWLRLKRVDVNEIENLDAWLTTVVSQVSLDLLRAPRRTREHSWQVEPWRDEPVALTGDPAAEVERSDQVSMALFVGLETLSPAERVAFVLHDVFGCPFEEVAEALDRSVDAARQLASRAPPGSGARPTRSGLGRVVRVSSSTPGSVPPSRVTSRRCFHCSTMAPFYTPTMARAARSSRARSQSRSRRCCRRDWPPTRRPS